MFEGPDMIAVKKICFSAVHKRYKPVPHGRWPESKGYGSILLVNREGDGKQSKKVFSAVHRRKKLVSHGRWPESEGYGSILLVSWLSGPPSLAAWL